MATNLEHMSETLSVSFVCTGNRARSPLAEALFRRQTEMLPVSVSSFGMLDLGGQPPLPGAITVARALGLDIAGHRTRGLQRGGLRDADLVIGFELAHVSAAIEVGGAERRRVFMLLGLPELLEGTAAQQHLPPVDGARHAIAEMDRRRASARPRFVPAVPDPLGGSPPAFAELGRVVEAMTGLLASRLFPSSRGTRVTLQSGANSEVADA
jgi:protein-tyrosine-phosphatase